MNYKISTSFNKITNLKPHVVTSMEKLAKI